MALHTCVSAAGRFVYGIHRPRFTAANFREHDRLADLGRLPDGSRHRNAANFPHGPVEALSADPIFEIPNAFPFRGTTYIGKVWADARAQRPETIRLPAPPEVSLHRLHGGSDAAGRAIADLPRPLKLALAVTSTDPRDLCILAQLACSFCMDKASNAPWGLVYEKRPDGRVRPQINDEALFEAVANNPYLPEAYRQAMVLRPGAQGSSEIVGEWCPGRESRVFEYLRRNSYIPWGHYAANMANDAVRYRLGDLTPADMTGMRHLYYQRTYARLADLTGAGPVETGRTLSVQRLEAIRLAVRERLSECGELGFDRTLWGWNFGFDYAPTGYRLHASHQQIHQQYALIPAMVPEAENQDPLPAYGCGDLVADAVSRFHQETGKRFFDCFEAAICSNRRMDGDPRLDSRLVVHADERVMLFVPKAQTSQWELQLMPRSDVGNILEADTAMRQSLDRAILMAVKVLGGLGAQMITTIEIPKAITDSRTDQRLLMSFLPRLPESPGAFSEAQLRWINGHYPEDFARACRSQLAGDDSPA